MRLAVFGLGETGVAFTGAAEAAGYTVSGFSRSRSWGEGWQMDASLVTDIERLEGNFQVAVVTFPPQVACPEFWDRLERIAVRRILLGSTGIYQRQGPPPQEITEVTAVDPSSPRTNLETGFMARRGLVVRLAGIYSPARNPIRWILDGRVGYEERQVNLVHTEDVASALLLLCRATSLKPVYNLADGQPHTWIQIIDRLVDQGWITHPRKREPLRRADSMVSNQLFRTDFPNFRFRDFWKELPQLARTLAGIRQGGLGGQSD